MDPNHKDVSSVVEADESEAMFDQTAHNVSYDDGKLPLLTLAPHHTHGYGLHDPRCH